jgi:hypothetical protein
MDLFHQINKGTLICHDNLKMAVCVWKYNYLNQNSKKKRENCFLGNCRQNKEI